MFKQYPALVIMYILYTVRNYTLAINLHCIMDRKLAFFVLFRYVHVPAAGASCRGGVDSRGQRMAAEEPGSCPNSLAKTYQP